MPVDNRDEQIQSYLNDKFKDTPLIEVVTEILKTEPEKVVTLPDVLSEIFPEDLPPAMRLKSRNRVANILSTGARLGDWYRSSNGIGYIFSDPKTL